MSALRLARNALFLVVLGTLSRARPAVASSCGCLCDGNCCACQSCTSPECSNVICDGQVVFQSC